MKKRINHNQIFEELKRASRVKPGRRFLSFFIDCILLIVLSYSIFLGANAIAKNTNSYQESSEIVQEEIDYYNQYVAESRAMEFEVIDGKTIRKSELYDKQTGISKLILENMNRAIYYSYLKYGDFNDEYGISISQEHMDLIKLSISEKGHEYDDNVSFFYTNYLLNTTDNFEVKFSSIEEAKEYVNKTYKDTFGEDGKEMFVFSTDGGLPILRKEAAYYLYYYIYISEDSKIVKSAEQYYYLFETAYQSMLSQAEKIMIKGEPYYSTHYVKYFDNNSKVGRITNIALIISIALAYILCIILPKIILRHERTIGRTILKLGVVTVYNEPVSLLTKIVKYIIDYIGYLSVILIIYMFPPFYGSFAALYMPFIGELQLMVILLVLIALIVINSTVMLFTRNKVGIDELILKIVLVDRNVQDSILEE